MGDPQLIEHIWIASGDIGDDERSGIDALPDVIEDVGGGEQVIPTHRAHAGSRACPRKYPVDFVRPVLDERHYDEAGDLTRFGTDRGRSYSKQWPTVHDIT